MQTHNKLPRRSVLVAMASAGLAATVPALHAQAAYPNKPIRLVVAFGTGSGNDIIARDLARYMGEFLGQGFVVDNRTGGGGSVGTDAVAKAADIALLHVPYKRNGPALIDLTGGHVNLLFDGFVSSGPMAQQGRARLLAVSGHKRSAVNPAVPTFAEQGLANYEATTWNNLFAPAQTPQGAIDKLNAALNKALAVPAIQECLAQGASEALGPSTPEQADVYGRAQRTQWVPFVRSLNIAVE